MTITQLQYVLAVAEHKSKRSFKWIYIAASFVGFTLIGFFLFNQQKSEGLIIPENNVVIEEQQPLKVIWMFLTIMPRTIHSLSQHW